MLVCRTREFQILACTMLECLTLASLMLECPTLASLMQACPTLASLTQACPILASLMLVCPMLECPTLANPTLASPIKVFPTQAFPMLPPRNCNPSPFCLPAQQCHQLSCPRVHPPRTVINCCWLALPRPQLRPFRHSSNRTAISCAPSSS